MSRITAAEVRAVELRRPGWGRRGYRPAEVDEFLTRAVDALEALAADRTAELTADQVHDVVFRKPPLGSRGYDEDQVDDLLDAIEHALRADLRWPASRTTELNGRPLEG